MRGAARDLPGAVPSGPRFARHPNPPAQPRCLHFNGYPGESGSQLLDPDGALGKGILEALRQWLDQNAPGASFESLKQTRQQHSLTPVETQAMKVLDIVSGLEEGLCSQAEKAN